MLYDYTDFVRVLHTLSKLSHGYLAIHRSAGAVVVLDILTTLLNARILEF